MAAVYKTLATTSTPKEAETKPRNKQRVLILVRFYDFHDLNPESVAYKRCIEFERCDIST